MQTIQSTRGINIIAAILLYATAIVYQGYQYGQSDQSQIIPVLYAHDHPESYSTDHYVNAFLESNFNERSIFHALFRWLGYDVPWIVFLWHAISSIALILALVSLSAKFIQSKALQWATVGLILIVGFHTSTGSNELYYNQFIPSLPAKAFGAWAIVNWMNKKFHLWIGLLLISTLLQPLVGMQVFLLTSLALIVEGIRNKKMGELPWKHLILYSILIIPFFVMLAIHNGGHADPAFFMQIMNFRLPHHFFGISFGLFNLALFSIFAAVTILFYSDKIKWFCILIVTGCIVYEIGVEFFKSTFVLYTQWWKTTIWLEAFAFIAVASLAEKSLALADHFKKGALLWPLILLVIVALYRLSGMFSEKPEYMQPLSNHKSDEVQISELALQLTPVNSVFIIPPEITSFRWYSKRSLFVDYKALLHNETFLKEWYSRIVQVYHFDHSAQASGETIFSTARTSLSQPSTSQVQQWKSSGITHIISYSNQISSLKLLGQNETYSIYLIP